MSGDAGGPGAAMSRPRLEPVGAGRLRLSGELSFASVPELAAAGLPLESGAGSVQVDLGAVVRADSAGLALLVGWMREAWERGVEIRFLNMPAQMLAIARVSGLDGVLPLERESA
jgi:phospholipid transport system transporter-binding protein